MVTDDGCGVPGSVVRSGLRNMEERAIALGGSFTLGAREEGGVRGWRGGYPSSLADSSPGLHLGGTAGLCVAAVPAPGGLDAAGTHLCMAHYMG